MHYKRQRDIDACVYRMCICNRLKSEGQPACTPRKHEAIIVCVYLHIYASIVHIYVSWPARRGQRSYFVSVYVFLRVYIF